MDTYPSHLLPATGDAKSALVRARISFFVDTWFSKVGSYWYQISRKETDEEKESLVQEFVAAVGKEIEPLLKDAAPFFGGSSKLTLAEVGCAVFMDALEGGLILWQAWTAPFILRIYTFAKNGILPQSVISGLDAHPNFSKWAAEVIKHDSVTYIWNEKVMVEGMRKRLASAKTQSK